jgi:hypothetical protein
MMEATFQYEPFGEDDTSAFGDFIDCAVEHLRDLNVSDVNVVLDKMVQSFTISILTEALERDSAETIIGKGMGAIRTAFHHCGVHTPNWPPVDDFIFGGVSLRPVNVREPVPA